MNSSSAIVNKMNNVQSKLSKAMNNQNRDAIRKNMKLLQDLKRRKKKAESAEAAASAGGQNIWKC